MPWLQRSLRLAFLLLLAGTSARAVEFDDVPVAVSGAELQALPVLSIGAQQALPAVSPLSGPQLPSVSPPSALQALAPADVPSLRSTSSQGPQASAAASQSAPVDAAWKTDVSALESVARPDDERTPEKLDALFNGGLSKGQADAAVQPAPAPGKAPDLLTETDGRRGRDLLHLLHEISGRGQEQHSYETSHKVMFAEVDNVTVNGVSGVYDVYSLEFVPGGSASSDDYKENGPHGKEPMNVEHVWPQSYFDHRKPMLSDMHHLLPTSVSPNSARGRLPFGEVTERADFSNEAGARAGGGFFEPPDASKGKIARAMLYFYVRYNDQVIFTGGSAAEFWNARIETLLRWNREHPPDDAEHSRNDRVQKYQGNRNPFVDDYTLADRIGADAFQQADMKSRDFKKTLRPRNGRYDGSR